MSHQLDTYKGQAAAVFAREDAWHKLGVVLPSTFTAEQAMSAGHLGGWDVRKTPLVTAGGLAVPSRYATVRTNPFHGGTDVLGVVGDGYTPIQNEEHCELLNALVDTSGAHFETAGSLRGGREVFVTMKLPHHMVIGGCDDLDLYLAALNSHDGTSAFRLMVTPVRIVCANTQAAAIGNNRGVFAIRHTVNARAAINEARDALGLTFAYLDGFQLQAERMIQEKLTEAEFMRIVETEFVPETVDSPRAQTNRAQTLEAYRYLFSEADTTAQIRGTRWAGYQAVAEYADHVAPVRAADQDTARAERTLAGTLTPVKVRAFDLFQVAV